MKRKLMYVMAAVCLTMFSNTLFAAVEANADEQTLDSSITSSNDDSDNYEPLYVDKLTTAHPEYLTRDGTIPRDAWNVWKKDYYFNGNGYNSVLYTEFRLYGKGDKSTYYVEVTNTGNHTVHVMCKRESKTYIEFDVGAGRTVKKSFNNIYTSTEWYLRFSAGKDKPFAVKGSVK